MVSLGTNKVWHSPRCSFCGSDDGLRCYTADTPGSPWYVCAECVELICNENWDDLIERIVAAFTTLQPMREEEQVAFREELENRLKPLSTFGLHFFERPDLASA